MRVGKGRLLNSAGDALDAAATIQEARLENGDVLTLHLRPVQVEAPRINIMSLYPPWELFFIFVYIKPKRKKQKIYIYIYIHIWGILFILVYTKPKRIYRKTYIYTYIYI